MRFHNTTKFDMDSEFEILSSKAMFFNNYSFPVYTPSDRYMKLGHNQLQK